MALKLVGTDAAFTDTVSNLLKTFLYNSYTLVTPAKTTIIFDTKFERFNKPNHIIVESMGKAAARQVLGATRWKYTEVKRLQIFCSGTAHATNHNLIEQHIEEIILGNVRGMIASGISSVIVSDFSPIIVNEESQGVMPGINTPAATRSEALVTLVYTKYKA